MIRKLIIRRFKRFSEETFEFPGHVVLAGPNNTGKTTVLQAIAAWDLALNTWLALNDFRRRKGGYTRAPITRQSFAAVPLRTFDLLWNERRATEPIEIELHSATGWVVAMEINRDSTEQIYVRPTGVTQPDALRNATLQTVYIPPMTGLSTDEPVYQPAKQAQLLGQGKPGDIIRNLLVQAHADQLVWKRFQEAIRTLFDFTLLPPNASGPNIIAEYETTTGGPRFDVASAGSGFQQVLMLLTFLYTRQGAVLLLDEPDAHLHMLLQEGIYGKLRSVAVDNGSQLIISTHSEVIIDTVEPKELCILLDKPRMLASVADRDSLREALRFLAHTDIMLALKVPGILYVEGHTDIDILREWAKTLDHPLHETLSRYLFWKEKEIGARLGAAGCKAKEHFEIVKLVKPDMRGVELIDGDDHKGIQSTVFEAGKLQRLRWRRYEIESYLVHPAAIDRFIEDQVGAGDISALNRQDAHNYFEKQLPGVLDDPLGENLVLENVKASEKVLPAILNAAGIGGIGGITKRDFFQIAAIMRPEEIHPEVIEKLDAIQQAFGL